MRTIRFLLLGLYLLPLAAAAEIYKYTDENGVVHYTDKAPAKGAKPVALPPLQTVPSAPPLSSSTPAAPPPRAAPADFALSIVSPSPEQTFREPGGNVDVMVSVQPQLEDGYGLMFYVDGAAATTKPLASTGFTLSGLERGSHAIAVAMVDPQGQEVARASVTVHIKSPTVKPQVVPRK